MTVGTTQLKSPGTLGDQTSNLSGNLLQVKSRVRLRTNGRRQGGTDERMGVPVHRVMEVGNKRVGVDNASRSWTENREVEGLGQGPKCVLGRLESRTLGRGGPYFFVSPFVRERGPSP